ncbi:hypothetical protein ACFX2I_025295 [Malus domestica]
MLALIPRLVLIVVVILIKLNLRRIKSAKLAALSLLVAEPLQRVRKRRIAQRRKLSDGIDNGFDQPLNYFAGLVVTLLAWMTMGSDVGFDP